MADMTRFDLDKVNVIGKLGTTPQERGLTTQQFKDKFDEGPIALGEFVNETLIPEVEAHLADNTNPHEVTAVQVGAVPATGGHVSGVLSVGNYMRFYPYNTTPGFRRCDMYLHVGSNTIMMGFRDENNNAVDGEMQINYGTVYHQNNTGKLYKGTGSPEGVLSAPIGALYQRTDGGASTTLYVKESGTGNTGWKAVQTV